MPAVRQIPVERVLANFYGTYPTSALLKAGSKLKAQRRSKIISMMSESDNRIQLATAVEDELFEYCQSDSLSEEVLRDKIELYGLESNNDSQIRNYQFFIAVCLNEKFTEAMIQCILEYFPDAVSATHENGCSPLHLACKNKSATLNIIRLLIDAAPESVRSVNNDGDMPLHWLCDHRGENEVMARAVLKLLIEKYPEAVRHADNDGKLPIHIACMWRSPDFCRALIDAYPGSEQITDANDVLPLHYVCANNSLAAVKYVYNLYPDAIGHATHGGYPIHAAIAGSSNPAAIGIIQFLFNCDPNQKLIQFQGGSLLHFACVMENVDSSIEVGIEIIEIIFDAQPEAIEGNGIGTDIQDFSQQVQTFINGELVYARKAKDHSLMTTPDDNGQLPLHTALHNNVRLGSIKLLVKGNPHAVQSPDNNGALPLHIACQHHDSNDVIDFLVELDTATLDAVDRDGNTSLHCACRGAKYDTIVMLLDKYDAVSVSKRNAQKKLPIELLWESNAVEDRGSVEYMESIFQLLKTYPETVMNNNDDDITQQAELGVCPENGKKRKWGTV